MSIGLLKEMFEEMVLKKQADLIPKYYHPEFLLTTNGEEMNYSTFLQMHEEVYATEIRYSVVYDEETLLEQGEKVAGRVWITVQNPGEPKREIEVVLIAAYKEGKLYRLWELTYPDWSKLEEFS
ncbi:MAG: hypothetical protein K940chlam9_00823 [Chlamydiae bacterium]|nr:hypothetical protein [Chlamydiota bacterium]